MRPARSFSTPGASGRATTSCRRRCRGAPGWCVPGRGAGKTRTGSEWALSRVEEGFGYLGLVGETSDDCREVIVEGPPGILKCFAAVEPAQVGVVARRRLPAVEQRRHRPAVLRRRPGPVARTGPGHGMARRAGQVQASGRMPVERAFHPARVLHHRRSEDAHHHHFHEAQRLAEEQDEGPGARNRVRIHFANLLRLAHADRPRHKAVACGSVIGITRTSPRPIPVMKELVAQSIETVKARSGDKKARDYGAVDRRGAVCRRDRHPRQCRRIGEILFDPGPGRHVGDRGGGRPRVRRRLRPASEERRGQVLGPGEPISKGR